MLTMWRVASLFLIGLLFLGNDITHSQQPPSTPTKQKPSSPIEGKEQTQQQVKSSADSSTATQTAPPIELKKQSNHNDNHGTDEGSEYWTMLGRRLKITDSLLALFTFCLVIVSAWQARRLR